MPITSEHAGRSYPPTAPYEVSAAKIAEFARAIGDDNPAYLTEAPLAPPTFIAVVAKDAWETMFADEDLGLALAPDRAWRSAVLLRPGAPGGRRRARDLDHRPGTAPRHRRHHLGHGSDRDPRGRARLQRRSHVLPHPRGRRVTSAPNTPRPAPEVGSRLPPLTVRFTRADLVRYAGASTDFNPIHYSDRHARQVGLPGVVAHGMLTMGAGLRVITDWLRDPGRRGLLLRAIHETGRRARRRFGSQCALHGDGGGGRRCSDHLHHRGGLRGPEGARRGTGGCRS